LKLHGDKSQKSGIFETVEVLFQPHENGIYVKVIAKRKSKAIAVRGRGGPWDFHTSRLPHFLDNRLTAARLSSYSPAELYPPIRFLVLIPVRGWVNPRCILLLKSQVN
jgi:hypothetical protein